MTSGSSEVQSLVGAHRSQVCVHLASFLLRHSHVLLNSMKQSSFEKLTFVELVKCRI